MKIAMLSPDYYPNAYAGVGIHVYSLAETLVKIYPYLQVSVFVVRCEKSINSVPTKRKLENGITIYEFETSGKSLGKLDYFTYRWTENNLIALEYISKYIENEYDLVHCHDMFPVWVMDYFKRTFKCPVISSIHARATGIDKIENALRGYIFHVSDAVIAVSKKLTEELIERFGYRENLYTIYNGVTHSDNINEIRKQDYISYCGRLSETKGIDTLIKAFKKLKDESDDWAKIKLKIIGTGHEEKALKDLSMKLRIDEDVQFLGSMDNKSAREVIRYASIHVVPSRYEPFATSALEAMEEGTPVVVSDVGGLSEMVSHMQNGFKFRVNQYDELSLLLSEIYFDTELKKQIIKSAKETVKKYYWDNIAKETMDVYLKYTEINISEKRC